MFPDSKSKIRDWRFILVIAILLAGAAFNYYFSRPDATFPRKSLSEFPRTLGEWSMVSDQQIDDKAIKVLQVDDYFVRYYRNSRGEVLGIYVGYWKSQREGKGIHSPRQCLPGSGWVPIDACVYPLSVERLSGHSTLNRQHSTLSPSTISVNKFIMGKGLDRQLYLFWYQGRGQAYASEYWNRASLIWDALTRKRTDGALIRINNGIKEDPEQALRIQTEFIDLFFPLLKEYIPE